MGNILLCVVGPLIINIFGEFRHNLLTLLGFMIFNETKPTNMVISGLMISFFGSVIFIYSKYLESFNLDDKVIKT